MGKQLPDIETTRLLISNPPPDSAEEETTTNKATLSYDTLPTFHSYDDEDDSERSEASLFSRGWTEYMYYLEAWPVLAKSLTAFLVLGLGDAFAQGGQHFVGGAAGRGFDCLRSLRFGVFGLIGAPWTHYYYHLLDSTLPPTPSPWTWTTLFKVIIDQFIQAPIALFFIIVGLDAMKGLGVEGEAQDLKVHYWETLVANWKLWLPASIINMVFVEPKLRVLFVNSVFFLWIIVLSVMLNP